MSLLRVENLDVRYPARHGEPSVKAVSDVSFSLEKGEVLGIVGESGCGKSTLARAILRLIPVHSGSIVFSGDEITYAARGKLKDVRRDMQVVFQDPFGALNPMHSVGRIIDEPLKVHDIGGSRPRSIRVKELLAQVGLPDSAMHRKPHEFSGGQRQRIAIARAIALHPKLLIADEAVSALDVSIQSQILNLLSELRKQLDLAMIFISHDLSVVRHISDRIAVMYLGHVVESGNTQTVLAHPQHPYTKALISAVPGWGRENSQRLELCSEIPDPGSPPGGCVFHPRCPFANLQCKTDKPDLQQRLIARDANEKTEKPLALSSFNACHLNMQYGSPVE